MSEIALSREWAMPSRWTFDIPPIKEFVLSEMDNGLWIDPFAGKSKLADVTNDIHPDRDTDYSLKAVDFLSEFDRNEIDGGVIFDPPYSATQLKRLYGEIDIEVEQDDTNGRFYGRNKDEIERICAPGSTVVSFGWGSSGIGKNRGFKKRKITLVCHGSSRNDTICVCEDYKSKNATNIEDF